MMDTSNLTPQQLSDFTAKKTSYFKGTIAVASIYGVIALSMFLITMFSPTGKMVIVEALLPFTITFIGGMIIVVTLLLIAVFSVKPPPEFKLEYDNYKCPDYWKLEETPAAVMNSIDPDDAARMKYRCVKPDVRNVNTLTPINNVNIDHTDTKNLLDKTQMLYGGYTAPTSSADGSGNLNCNIVYPEYMNYIDETWEGNNNPLSKNKLRCEYANKCSTSWTAACPAK